MNRRTGRTLLATLLALSSLTLQPQSTNLLEGFEERFTTNSGGNTNVAVFTLLGGRAADGQVSVSHLFRRSVGQLDTGELHRPATGIPPGGSQTSTTVTMPNSNA